MCLAATKLVLRKINSGVWFIQTFLQKILYMPNFPYTSSTVNMQIMNNSTLIHKRNKTQQKNSSNPVKLRSHGGGEGEIVRWRRDRAARSSGAMLRSMSGAVLQSMIGAVRSSNWSSVCGRRTGAQGSPTKSLLPLSLRSGLSLSLSLRKCFEVKLGTENNFRGQSLIFMVN